MAAVGVGFGVVAVALGVGLAVRVGAGAGVAGLVLLVLLVLLTMARVGGGVLLLGAALSVLVATGDAVGFFAGDFTIALVSGAVGLGAFGFAFFLAPVFFASAGGAAELDATVRAGTGVANWVESLGVALPVSADGQLVDTDGLAGAGRLADAERLAGPGQLVDSDDCVDVDPDGAGAGVVGVGVVGEGVGVGAFAGVGDVSAGEGDGLGDEAGSCTGSQDLPLAAVAALAAVLLAATARLAPETPVSRRLPATSVTVGRACAKRMKCPYL